ncbi:MAG TPA: hypothetical protein VFN25_02870, partial [Dokdonella sp.]|uniref:hypothetical protein n=1 Tax=Dokdonella sp. TaxID=2291710 RepID=UPI002D80E93D
LCPMQSASQPLEKALEAFAAIPNLQAAFIVLFVVFSVVAGNAVVALHGEFNFEVQHPTQ